MKYDFYEEDPEEDLKYKVGDDLIKIGEIENSTLIIAFDFISLNSSNFCFNNPDILAPDYAQIYELKKEISSIPIIDFIDDFDTKKKYHFHNIDLYSKKFLINKLKKLLNYNQFIEAYSLPTLYQIAVYTEKAPRIVGFFGKKAIFYLLWLDYDHQIYQKKLL